MVAKKRPYIAQEHKCRRHHKLSGSNLLFLHWICIECAGTRWLRRKLRGTLGGMAPCLARLMAGSAGWALRVVFFSARSVSESVRTGSSGTMAITAFICVDTGLPSGFEFVNTYPSRFVLHQPHKTLHRRLVCCGWLSTPQGILLQQRRYFGLGASCVGGGNSRSRRRGNRAKGRHPLSGSILAGR